jgi:hypothetical protein
MTPAKGQQKSGTPNKKERAKGPLLIKTNHEFETNIRCFLKDSRRPCTPLLPEVDLLDAVEIVDSPIA